MLGSDIVSEARKFVNDTDATNPFHTDAQCYALLSDWLQELELETGHLRKQQTISFAISDGGQATSKALDNDWLIINLVQLVKSDETSPIRLSPRTEEELTAEIGDWRQLTSGLPSYYLVRDAITAQAVAIGPARTITTERPLSEARTMRIYGWQAPAILSAGTNSPVFSVAFHKSGAYYLAWQMQVPRNAQKAEYFRGLWENQRRRVKTLFAVQKDTGDAIWDHMQND